MSGVVIFLLGVIVGSFLNVCIHRVPLRKSIVLPRSACPHCEHHIAFYDNFPVVSFFVLKGRCRRCKAPISVQYPAVEVLNGALWLIVWLKFGLTLSGAIYCAFVSSMVVLAVIDARHRILPHGITFSGLVAGFLTAPWQAVHREQGPLVGEVLQFLGAPPGSRLIESWTSSLLGVACGGGLLLAVAAGYYLVKKREGMGHGDIIMMGFVGAVLGWRLTFLTIFLGSFLGVIGWVVAAKRDRAYEIPFGTFLAAGAVLSLLAGPPLLDWYWNLFNA